MEPVYDVIVIGAGIAGASLAAELAQDRSVLLLEREDHPGYHATGRSAAAFIPSYGASNPALRLLTACSKPFFESPPENFSDVPLLHSRGLMTLFEDDGAQRAREEQASLNTLLQCGITDLDKAQILARIPLLRDNWCRGAWFESDVADIDVHALHQAHLRVASAVGTDFLERAEVKGIDYRGGLWRLKTSRGVTAAPRIVNAAGAWADSVAMLAGAKPLGLQPLRRTAVLIRPPDGIDVSEWPLVFDHEGRFYIKPDAGLILVSPADEHPSPPCDARPEELDIAYAVHFAEQALDFRISSVEHSWAGLRTFAADRTPIIGPDPRLPGWFWLAGQGGHGIQIAPAAAKLAAALFDGQAVPEELAASGFDEQWVSVERIHTKEEHRHSA